MLRHCPRLLGGLLLTAALVVSVGVSHAAPEDALMPLETYTTLKGKSLASAHRTRLLQVSAQIYNCLPWLDVRPGGLGFPRARESEADDRYLSTWIYVDQREDPVLAALPDVVDDGDVTGLSVVLSWLKPGTSRPGRQAVTETFSLFIDKATLRDFLAKRVSAEEFTNRAKFNLFDGVDLVGRVPIEVWEDSFNSTYKATNIAPPKGAICP